MTTAADYQTLAAEAMRDTLRAQGVAEQVRLRGRTVCDVCGDAIDGNPKITSTENDGTKLDFCTTSCFIDFTRTAATK